MAELTKQDDELRFRAEPELDLTGLDGAREEAPGQYAVRGPVDPDLIATVTGWCARNGVLVADLRTRSLEDVFLELTGRDVRT